MGKYCKNCYWPCVDHNGICPWCGERVDRTKSELWLRLAIAGTAAVVLAVVLICRAYGSEPIPEARAVRAIIGEASGEGYTGMLAIAGAIRNRGTLQGVYGEKAKHVDKQPRWVWDQARKAWKESANKDITSGADHWGSVTVDAAWITTMRKGGFKEAFRYRNHIFFKRIKKG